MTIQELKTFLSGVPEELNECGVFYRNVSGDMEGVDRDDILMIAEDIPLTMIEINEERTEMLLMNRESALKIQAYRDLYKDTEDQNLFSVKLDDGSFDLNKQEEES